MAAAKTIRKEADVLICGWLLDRKSVHDWVHVVYHGIRKPYLMCLRHIGDLTMKDMLRR